MKELKKSILGVFHSLELMMEYKFLDNDVVLIKYFNSPNDQLEGTYKVWQENNREYIHLKSASEDLNMEIMSIDSTHFSLYKNNKRYIFYRRNG